VSASRAKRKPSKRERQRRNRQSGIERAIANTQAQARSRARRSWQQRSQNLLKDVEAARKALAVDPELTDQLYEDWTSLPPLERGLVPVSVVEGEQRTKRKTSDESRAVYASSFGWTGELPNVTDVSAHDSWPLPERSDFAELERQAEADLQRVRRTLDGYGAEPGEGSAVICQHSSFVLFDGYALGTAWPDSMTLPGYEPEVKSRLRNRKPRKYPWPGRYAYPATLGGRLATGHEVAVREAALQAELAAEQPMVHHSGSLGKVPCTGPFGAVNVRQSAWPQHEGHYHASGVNRLWGSAQTWVLTCEYVINSVIGGEGLRVVSSQSSSTALGAPSSPKSSSQ
jgi:hypothetical protein